jgi:predicted ATP-binding protein involved in virulence
MLLKFNKISLIKLILSKKKITIDEKKIKGNVSFNNVKLGDLSFGEKFKILLFSQIYEKLCQNKNAIIFLDEVTLSFHPNWEKAFIQELITLFNDYNVHFIISSHSTFILSDIPKEHIIFLGQDREGNCQKISNTINITQTFGANIHTLLSHGFFMDGGLMGEFAKGKIEEIKKFYELVKFLEKKLHQKPYCYVKLIFIFKIKEFRHIQSIIGEPFLQTVIKNYLDELEIIFNGEKQFLKQEIKRLQDLESRL